jgi:hypothetical protein
MVTIIGGEWHGVHVVFERRIGDPSRNCWGDLVRPAIASELSTTGAEQLLSAYDDSNPIVAGVGRTLSRGLR